ncbi:MAG: (2Fe-2S)-binding protein [Candidatus Limnocylindrales bacterium]
MIPVDASRVVVKVEVNGHAHEVPVAPDRVLLDVLRDDLGLTGTKEGCSVGVCGLCCVLVDGTLMTACLLPAVKVDGRSVVTIEGIAAPDGTPSAVQAAFIRHGGFQCGICTPGQVIAATALLAEDPHPTEERVRVWMTGNLCRCTGYYGIVEAVLAASGREPGGLHMRPPLTEAAAPGPATGSAHDAG